MNIVDWHKAFKVQLDTLDTQSALRLQPEVVDIFFNKAINKIMMELYDQYEESQELSDALSSQTLVVRCAFAPTGFPNQWKISFPLDYYHHLQSNANIKIGNVVGPVRTVKQLLDNESKVLSNPFERADDTEMPLFFKNSGIYAYTPPGASLDSFYMTYLKNPKQVSYKQYIANGSVPGGIGDTDIDEYLHERIINLAVIYALETYGSERTPSKVQIKDVT